MTQHSSLKIKGIGLGHRSVLKRFERILKLQKEERWKEGDPVLGLPKVKTIRVKIKKEKAAAPATVVAPGAAGVPEGGPATTATPAAPRKTPTAPALKIEEKAKPQTSKASARETKKKKKS